MANKKCTIIIHAGNLEAYEIRSRNAYYTSVLWVFTLEVSTFSVMKLYITKVRWSFMFVSINKQPWGKSIMLFDDAICKSDAVWDTSQSCGDMIWI